MFGVGMSLRQEDEPLECLEVTLKEEGGDLFHLTAQSCLWNLGHGSPKHLVCHLSLCLLMGRLVITGLQHRPRERQTPQNCFLHTDYQPFSSYCFYHGNWES